MSLTVHHFLEPNSQTFSYVISESLTGCCAIIDPVLNFNIYTGHVTTPFADEIIDYVRNHHLSVQWIFDTHIHADHLTAAAYIQKKLGGKTGVGSQIIDVLDFWVPIFNNHADTPLDGSQFDHLFEDHERFSIGPIHGTVIATPGHTCACVSLLIQNHLFVGDTLFMPDIGTARTDFPGGDAGILYDSIQKLYQLPNDTIVHLCHDYPPEHRAIACETTIKEQKEKNILINQNTSKSDYIAQRCQRDQNKPPPQMLLPSIQVNLRSGHLGRHENNRRQYIKIPINSL